MSWLLEQISIEGFRGINNAGGPLELKFHPDKVNSISAPNGSGKSSIFEAVTYAISGVIPKLDVLPGAERGGVYYLNQFHPAKRGTVSLSLKPVSGGPSTIVSVSRDENGARTVTTDNGNDGSAILAQLNHELTLLDAQTFQKFIADTPLHRGRSFSGLLGLGKYSTLRQALQTLARTMSFNNHFQVAAKTGKKKMIEAQVTEARYKIQASYFELVGEQIGDHDANEILRTRAITTLGNVSLLAPHCIGKNLNEISFEDFRSLIREAEGGEDRARLGKLLQDEATVKNFVDSLPPTELVAELISLARERDGVLADTQGDEFLSLYKLIEKIVAVESWDKNSCPSCDRHSDVSILDHMRAKLSLYDAVAHVSERLTKTSSTVDWDKLVAAEKATQESGEIPLFKDIELKSVNGILNEACAVEMEARITLVRTRALAMHAAIVAEKETLEKRLPPSMVAVTEKIDAAHRLQSALEDQEVAADALAALVIDLQRIDRIKVFLTKASAIFSEAESTASKRRLAAVEPLCKEFFKSIMFDSVVPTISKRDAGEDLFLSLEKFYELENQSAQSLLSESFRNAFAISIYLSAAFLYGGSAKFLLLDDVTSSFDGGHQFHLMEVIRTRLSRPHNVNGPQIIILSHDTLLEKYFNTQSLNAGWWHQRIEGSPRTAIWPQSNAVNRVRDETIRLLQAGNTADAVSRIRDYLEYVLERIITSCRIPVPMDIALNDSKRIASYLIDAINAQVDLHRRAQSLILEPAQIQSLNLAVVTITGNFLSHWATGQVQAYTPAALLGVMQAIENYADCFKFEPAPGAPRKYYSSLSQR